MGERWKATDAFVAVGTDVVVAWQCSQRLVELVDEQMAVGVDAVPPSGAAATLRQMVLPDATARHRTAGAVLLSHRCTRSHTILLSQHVGSNTSNCRVMVLSVSSRILPLPPTATQLSAIVRASDVVHGDR